MRWRAAVLLLGLAAFLAAWLAIAAGALSVVALSRTATVSVTADDQAVLALSGFQGQTYTLTNRYLLTGTVQNRAAAAVSVQMTVDPLVTRACRGKACGQSANWSLFFCWAPTTSPEDKTSCTGGQELTSSGTGPQDPGPQTTTAISVPPGGSRYVFVRVTGNADQFCAASGFRWDLAYTGGSMGTVAHTSGNPRYQTYQIAGASC